MALGSWNARGWTRCGGLRILPHNDGADIVQGSEMQRRKHFARGRENDFARRLLILQRFFKLRPKWLRESRLQVLRPTAGNTSV